MFLRNPASLLPGLILAIGSAILAMVAGGVLPAAVALPGLNENAVGSFDCVVAAGSPVSRDTMSWARRFPGANSGNGVMGAGTPSSFNPPTIVSPAAATPNPVTVTSTQVSVLASTPDPAGESSLTYTWSTTGVPPAAVGFIDNQDNTAKNTTAVFTMAGTYQIQVSVSDALHQTTTSAVTVTVDQTAVMVNLVPSTVNVAENGSTTIAATATDQFSQPISNPPVVFSISAGSGSGSINPGNGGFRATSTPGPVTVMGQDGAAQGSSTITVVAPPTVVNAASATPSSVTTTSTALSALGASSLGPAQLIYTWSVMSPAPAAVSFTPNGTNAAQACTAVFTAAGVYNLQVLIADSLGQSVTSLVTVTVVSAPTAELVTPTTALVGEGHTQSFSASAVDQFGTPIPGPAAVFSVPSVAGSITSSGLFTAGTIPGSSTVTATAGSLSGSASITIQAPPTVVTAAAATPSPVAGTTTVLSVLGGDSAGESTLIYTWTTTGVPPATVTFTVNGTNAAKNTTAVFTAAGSYGFQVTITDGLGQAAFSQVTVIVAEIPSAIVVTPSTANLTIGGTTAYAASVIDQFGIALAAQPGIVWTATLGTIDGTGLFTATTAGTAVITAAAASLTGTAGATIAAAAGGGGGGGGGGSTTGNAPVQHGSCGTGALAVLILVLGIGLGLRLRRD